MKCEICGKETGKPTKRFCGTLQIVGSCAVKNRIMHNKRRNHELQGLRPKHTGDEQRRLLRDAQLKEQDYCPEARDSGYF